VGTNAREGKKNARERITTKDGFFEVGEKKGRGTPRTMSVKRAYNFEGQEGERVTEGKRESRDPLMTTRKERPRQRPEKKRQKDDWESSKNQPKKKKKKKERE